MQMYHIDYKLPKVTLLQESGLGVAEIAARTCYDSFENSEHDSIKNAMSDMNLAEINAIEDSELLRNLAWVHHHHSIIEHSTLSYLIQGTSRGVLQEHARHRLQAISVRSTRYTMSSLINAFVASLQDSNPYEFFKQKILELDIFVIADEDYLDIEIKAIFDKLSLQYKKDNEFISNAIAKSSLEYLQTYKNSPQELYQALQNGKKKRNVGDGFKHIVTDNWKVDMVVTFNIRSLKNYFDLRDSGAAWFQIRWLAQEMKKVTPAKYLRLIDKKYKNEELD
jgi:thymidylate synthase (FAD)